MSIALLATGDEIVAGDIINSNAQTLAHILHSQGLPVGLHMVCSDKETEIHDCIQFLAQCHSVILIIGGLGPTSDDKTRFSLSRFIGEKLVIHKAALEHIHARLASLQLPPKEGNQQQALFFANATLLPNPFGTALGCDYISQKKRFVLLPGPPRECLPMFEEHVLPHLQEQFQKDTVLLKWRIFAVPEGKIADQIDKALANLHCRTGYRLDIPYVECKVTCHSHLVATVKAQVFPLLKPHIISSSRASQELLHRLLKMQTPLVIHDEATGGVLQTLLQKPQTYAFLRFQERKEKDCLYFHFQGLHNYWVDKETGGVSSVSLTFHHQEKVVQEEKTLPLIGNSVAVTAAEWLCFRMLALLYTAH